MSIFDKKSSPTDHFKSIKRSNRINQSKQKSYKGLFLGCCLGFMAMILVTTSLPVQASSFGFNPSSKQFLEGCKSVLSVEIDPATSQSNAADIEIKYNPSQITILDSVADIDGVQIKPGNAYESYFGNEVDTNSGIIRLAGGSFTGSLKTKKTFASIEFQSKTGVVNTQFQIRFDGAEATLDSNIADVSTSRDTLSSVTNGSYTFTSGPCQADNQPPTVVFENPQEYSSGYDVNGFLNIRITDNQSGLDLNTLQIFINGETYKANDPEVTYTGAPLNYVFVIKPRKPLSADQQSVAQVIAFDLKGNKRNSEIVFNIPPKVKEELICPDPNLVDTDKDGTPNISDPDIDGDGILNANDEDADGDKIPNNSDSDTNGNGVSDQKEELDNQIIKGNNPFVSSSLSQEKITIFVPGSKQTLFRFGFDQLSLFVNLLFAFFAILAYLLGRKIYILQDVAYDIKSEKVIKSGIAKIIDIDSTKTLSEQEINKDGEFVFEVKKGNYQVAVRGVSTYFVQSYKVPGLNSLQNYHSSLSQASKGGYLQVIRHILLLIQSWLIALAPGFYVVAVLFALWNVLIFPSILTFAILILLALFWIVKKIFFS